MAVIQVCPKPGQGEQRVIDTGYLHSSFRALAAAGLATVLPASRSLFQQRTSLTYWGNPGPANTLDPRSGWEQQQLSALTPSLAL